MSRRSKVLLPYVPHLWEFAGTQFLGNTEALLQYGEQTYTSLTHIHYMKYTKKYTDIYVWMHLRSFLGEPAVM